MYGKGQVIELEISAFAFGGKGIAKVATENGDLVFFVENTGNFNINYISNHGKLI